MAITFDIRPHFAARFVPFLNAGDTRSLSLVSKATNEMLQTAAGAQQHNDINLAGGRISINLDKSVSALVRQKLKMEFLSGRPELLEGLRDTKNEVSTAGYNPNDITTLVKYSIRTQQYWLQSLIVPFDFNTTQIPARGIYGIGSALINAILYLGSKQVRLVLSHPSMANVPAEDTNYGLDGALGAAAHVDNPEFVRAVLSFPNAVNIQVKNGYYGLEPVLLKSVRENKPKCALCIREILAHPNAVHIPIKSLKQAYKTAQDIKNEEAVQVILQFTHSLQVN